VLAKLWRFCFYRDSGPTLILNRDLLVEHEAYMTLAAGRAGVPVPEVLAVGRFGPSGDSAIVTGLPGGTLLADADLSAVPDRMLDDAQVPIVAQAWVVVGAVPGQLPFGRCLALETGGAGVVEAGLIAGLTSAGVPQSQAVAAVFIQRLFAAYLPPIWGWLTLAWMRRREYV